MMQVDEQARTQGQLGEHGERRTVKGTATLSRRPVTDAWQY